MNEKINILTAERDNGFNDSSNTPKLKKIIGIKYLFNL